jgi:hypothetical protein
VTVRTHYGLPSSVQALDAPAHGLPMLPSLPLSLIRGTASSTPPVEELASIMLECVRGGSADWTRLAA